jgi:RAMP superfamily
MENPKPANRPIKRADRTSVDLDEQDPRYADKPYDFVRFSNKPPQLRSPIGHDRYQSDLLHGRISLKIHVLQGLHNSTGVTVLGTDLKMPRLKLVKSMVQGEDRRLRIQGSSIKGCIRAIYEAISNSKLGVKSVAKNAVVPERFKPVENIQELCPASHVFGAENWQGLLEFHDAICETEYEESVVCIPSLWGPQSKCLNYSQNIRGQRLLKGRKFYHSMVKISDKHVDETTNIQIAASMSVFSTHLNFKNMSHAELGCLLISIGQDPEYPLMPKLGLGKSIGLGSVRIEPIDFEIVTNQQDMKERYKSYKLSSSCLDLQEVQVLIKDCIDCSQKDGLMDRSLLQQLANILTNQPHKQPPEGVY